MMRESARYPEETDVRRAIGHAPDRRGGSVTNGPNVRRARSGDGFGEHDRLRRTETMTSNEATIRTLLIEDNAGDVALVRTYLDDADGGPYETYDVDTLERALGHDPSVAVDAVLLDLNLPDCTGLRTFESVHEAMGDVPIIVLSGVDDLAVARQAVQGGAQDYLLKDQLTAELLARSIHYSIERFRILRELQSAKEREEAERLRLERELERLETFIRQPTSPASAEALGLKPLAEAHPAQFDQLIEAYLHFIFESMERQVVEHKSEQVRDSARRIAESLGTLRSGPRDVLDLHMAALRREEADGNLVRRAAFYHEGRFAVLEVMSHLVSYYRHASVYFVDRKSPTSAGNDNSAADRR